MVQPDHALQSRSRARHGGRVGDHRAAADGLDLVRGSGAGRDGGRGVGGVKTGLRAREDASDSEGQGGKGWETHGSGHDGCAGWPVLRLPLRAMRSLSIRPRLPPVRLHPKLGPQPSRRRLRLISRRPRDLRRCRRGRCRRSALSGSTTRVGVVRRDVEGCRVEWRAGVPSRAVPDRRALLVVVGVVRGRRCHGGRVESELLLAVGLGAGRGRGRGDDAGHGGRCRCHGSLVFWRACRAKVAKSPQRSAFRFPRGCSDALILRLRPGSYPSRGQRKLLDAVLHPQDPPPPDAKPARWHRVVPTPALRTPPFPFNPSPNTPTRFLGPTLTPTPTSTPREEGEIVSLTSRNGSF